MTLTPHPLLVPWSRKSIAIPLLPLWAVRPVQSLSACTRVHFTFTFTLPVPVAARSKAWVCCRTFLGSRVRISPGAWMSVCCECCVLSGRGLCVGLITRPEESYRPCVCVCVCVCVSGACVFVCVSLNVIRCTGSSVHLQ